MHKLSFQPAKCWIFVVLVAFISCAVPNKSITRVALEEGYEIQTDPNYKPKPTSFYAAILHQPVASKGFCKVHAKEGRYYLEIPDAIFEKDLLVVNRISKAAAQVRPDHEYHGYGADQIGENVIRFYKGTRNRVFIKKIDYSGSRSGDSSENGMYRAVHNSNLFPIMVAFDIKAAAPDSGSVLIDLTDYINSDNDLFFFSGQQRRLYHLGQMQQDRSYTRQVVSFDKNIEIKTVKTFSNGNGGTAQQLPYLTYELNTSIVLLPEIPMKARWVDERVGYFGRGYVDFDIPHPQGFNSSWMVTRWRLEPRDEDIDKYLAGELVTPKKPIIYYIDPATPKKWVPYLINGVNAWQKAFEKAGFKNAIYAMEAPVDNPEWSLEDTRHSAIVYKASPVQNASGPNVNDPRSGEILEAHINWYHNITEVLHDWYFIQASPNDATARKMILDDTLMGKLISFVCTHEVGHTLGLAHNFAASATVAVDSLRSKHWVKENGMCPSVMDYARFNYVAQPEDQLEVNELIPRIGAYDEWAIEWAYRWLPGFASPAAEKEYLNQWVIGKLSNPVLQYAYGGAKCQSEDLGDDAVKAGRYGIRNLKRILPQLKKWSILPNENYAGLHKMERELLEQFRRYLSHVSEHIGGRYHTPKTVEQAGSVVSYPGVTLQQEAVRFLQQELFTTPGWLMENTQPQLTGGIGYQDLLQLQKEVLGKILSTQVVNRLLLCQLLQPKQAYTPHQLMNELEKGIWSELRGRQPISFYRRNLQKAYVAQLIRLQQGDQPAQASGQTADASFNDVSSLIKGHKKMLLQKLVTALPGYKDETTRWHLADMVERLQFSINNNNKPSFNRGMEISAAEDELQGDPLPVFEKVLQSKLGNCWNTAPSTNGTATYR